MHARLTLIGIQNELSLNSKSIDDTWTLDNETFDRDTLLYTIINKGASFSVMYTDPDYFYLMCAYFWKKWQRTFEKWFDLFDMEYNPINNYDRHIEWTENIEDNTDRDIAVNRSVNASETVDNDSTSNTTTSDSEATTSNNTTTTDNTTTNTVSAFDANGYSDHDKSVLDGEGTSNTTGSKTASGTVGNTSTEDISRNATTQDASTTEDDTDYTREHTHNEHNYGNIGVTTYQKMMREEFKIQMLSIYDQIADIFIREMLVAVY